MEETGIDLFFYTRRTRKEDELFPWDFIDAGVSRNFLLKEWQRALEGQVTPNCRQKCSGCGSARYGGGVCVMPKECIGDGIPAVQKDGTGKDACRMPEGGAEESVRTVSEDGTGGTAL